MGNNEALKNMASSSSLRTAEALEAIAGLMGELLIEQERTVDKLGIICDYKKEQAASDSKSRKINTCIGVVGIAIAIATIYIVDWANLIKALF